MIKFFNSFWIYFVETFPALMLGLFISGIIHEFVPENWVEENLGKKGFKAILFSTVIGAVIPVCCWGALPIAVSFRKKGASLGPIFAFLIATPATSINALVVTWKFLGFGFMAYIFVAVIIMGLVSGLVGNLFKARRLDNDSIHDECKEGCECSEHNHNKTIKERVLSVLKYAFIDMPKEIGLEMLLGLALAALVSSVGFIGKWIKSNLTGGFGYVFAVIFGLLMYMCATMSIPFIHAFIEKGMNIGAGMAMLIIGPIVSYGTILVLRKEFGLKVMTVFIGLVVILSVVSGYIYSII